MVVEWQQSGPPKLRATPEALLLTAACQWILNSLHSTPDTGPSYRDLMDAVLPHIERAGADPDILIYGRPSDEDDEEHDSMLENSSDSENEQPPRKRRRTAMTAPAMLYGLVFLRTIRAGPRYPVPRLEGDRTARISARTFEYLFKAQPDELETELFRKKLNGPPNPNRVPNKVRKTQRYIPPEDEERVDFNVSSRGVQLLEPPRDPGSDLEDNVDEDPDTDVDIDTALTHLWRQFLLDLTAKAPNQKGARSPSYCKLNAEERLSVTEATYQNERLSDYFLDCQWKIPTTKEWTMVFDRLWPKDTGYITAQNYKQTTYFPQWIKRLEDLDEVDVPVVRKALKDKFDKLYWVPFAQTDRIWGTKYMSTFQKSSGVDRKKAAPQIFLNPKAEAPIW